MSLAFWTAVLSVLSPVSSSFMGDGSSAVSTPVLPNGDPCGPAIQDNPNYLNTCAAKVSVTTRPEAYGVYCDSEGPSNIEWAACKGVAEVVCENIRWTQYPKGAWVWTDPGTGCAIGTWMPTGAGAAMTPSNERCQDLIFKAMTATCSSIDFSSNLASVNLATWPSFSDVTQTGSQVNVGYPSYIIAGKSPKGLNELPWNLGWSTAKVQAGTGLNSNNQEGLSESIDRPPVLG